MESLRVIIKATRLRGGQKTRVEACRLTYTPQLAGEEITVIFNRPLPATLHILCEYVETDGNCCGKCYGLGRVFRNDGLQRALYRGLLHDGTNIAGMEP